MMARLPADTVWNRRTPLGLVVRHGVDRYVTQCSCCRPFPSITKLWDFVDLENVIKGSTG
jgi:hypothetical protein